MKSPVLGDDLKKLYPITFEGQSDTATFDNALELLTMSGYSLAHAVMMMIPEAWEQHTEMDARRRAFYEYHAAMMEPWDGPAAMVFTDGRQIGATLDRNGLRPARYIVTDDDLVVMASETGVLPIAENRIVKKWRLQPGKMFLIDFEQGRIVDDEELKNQFASAKPYRQWIDSVRIKLEDLPQGPARGRVRGEPARSPAGLRLHAGRHQVPDEPDGAGRRGRHRLDGQRLAARGAVGQEQAALQLLQAAVRAGHEPADRSDPRIDRDVAGLVHRPQARPARHQRRQPADAARGRAADPRRRRHGAAALDRGAHRRQVQELRDRHHLSARLGRRRRRGQARLDVRRKRRRDQERPQHPDHQRPAHEPRAGRAAGRARAVGRAPAPGARGPAHDRRPRRRDRLGARGAPLRRPRRLRRRGRPSVPRPRDAGRAARRAAEGARHRQGDLQLRQGDRQGSVEDHVEDGRVDLHVVLRRAAVRGDRPREVAGRQVLPRHRQPGRRHRRVRRRRGGDPHAPRRVRRRPGARRHARRRRRIRLARARRRAHVDARRDRQAAARRSREPLRDLQGIRAAHQRPVAAPHDAARPVRVRRRSGEVDPDRRGRAGRARSSSASPPARCRSARSRPRRTPRSPSR